LEKILSGITKKVFNDEVIPELTARVPHIKCTKIPALHPTSHEYFDKAKNEFEVPVWGYPRGVKGLGTGEFEARQSRYFFDIIHKDITKIKNYLGALDTALCMFYPEDGYIGWHHNGNAEGYNILFSYSIDGDGRFEYYDYKTKSIQQIQDKPGWNVKCGYYPSDKREPERVYWHAAATKNPRLSIAFIINNRDMWINMIDVITKGDYTPDVTEKQGPLSDLE